MDKAVKFFKKLSAKEAGFVSEILLQVDKGTIKNLDTKKLKGTRNLFRVRVGDIRIVFERSKRKDVYTLVFIGRRSDKTYRNLK